MSCWLSKFIMKISSQFGTVNSSVVDVFLFCYVTLPVMIFSVVLEQLATVDFKLRSLGGHDSESSLGCVMTWLAEFIEQVEWLFFIMALIVSLLLFLATVLSFRTDEGFQQEAIDLLWISRVQAWTLWFVFDLLPKSPWPKFLRGFPLRWCWEKQDWEERRQERSINPLMPETLSRSGDSDSDEELEQRACKDRCYVTLIFICMLLLVLAWCMTRGLIKWRSI